MPALTNEHSPTRNSSNNQSVFNTNQIAKYRFIHHFIPHEHHNTRANLLSHHALFGYMLLLIALMMILALVPRTFPGVLGYASNIDVQTLLNETNQTRQEHGLKPLTVNPQLTLAAQKKAEHMFANNYWSHIAPDGTDPWDFILGEDYDYSYAGENLAKNFNDSTAVVQAWYDSPTHRENLLNQNYDEIGFAVVNGVLDGYETTLVVQMFGRPRTPVYIASNNNEPAPAQSESVAPAESTNQNPAQNPQAVPAQVTPPTEAQTQESGAPVINQEKQLTFIDVASAQRGLVLVFVGFLLFLLGVDIWYTRKKSLPKLTGHTLAHMLFLGAVVVSILFLLQPGVIR